MDQTFFTVSFVYEIIPASLQVDLCADIELINDNSCQVHNIRRHHTDESPLLPVLKLIKVDGRWIHSDSNKESNISKAIGECIDARHKPPFKSPAETKKTDTP